MKRETLEVIDGKVRQAVNGYLAAEQRGFKSASQESELTKADTTLKSLRSQGHDWIGDGLDNTQVSHFCSRQRETIAEIERLTPVAEKSSNIATHERMRWLESEALRYGRKIRQLRAELQAAAE